jgi:hypothetical protein
MTKVTTNPKVSWKSPSMAEGFEWPVCGTGLPQNFFNTCINQSEHELMDPMDKNYWYICNECMSSAEVQFLPDVEQFNPNKKESVN